MRITISHERPGTQPVHRLETLEAIRYVFNKHQTYHTVYGKELMNISGGYGFFLGFDDEDLHDRDLLMTLFALYPDKGALARYGRYLGGTATTLIKEKSKPHSNGQSIVDIVRDVVNAASTRWVCFTLDCKCGLPISDSGDEVNNKHEDFAALYATIAPEHGWAIHERGIDAAKKLVAGIKDVLPIPKKFADPTTKELMLETVKNLFTFVKRICGEMYGEGTSLEQHSALTFLNRMVKSNRSQEFRLGELTKGSHLEALVKLETNDKDCDEIILREEKIEERRLIANILGLAIVTSVKYSQTLALAIDFYLDDRRSKQREDIIKLSKLSPKDAQKQNANAKIMGFIREAQRLGQPLGLLREAVQDDTIPQGKELPSISVKKGDLIFADLGKAHLNPTDFKDPLEIDPDRKIPTIQGVGFHKCPAISFVDETMPEIFKAVFRLKNIRRAQGKAGRLEQIACRPDAVGVCMLALFKSTTSLMKTIQSDPKVYVDTSGELSYFPRSLSVIVRLLPRPQWNLIAYIFPQYDVTPGEGTKATKVKKWKVDFGQGEETKKLRKYVDRIMKILFSLLVIFLFFYVLRRLSGCISLGFLHRSRHTPRPSTPRSRVDTSALKVEVVECALPTTRWTEYEIQAFAPGSDGVTPDPIEYTSTKSRAHQLTVVAIDTKDLRMGVYVDDVLRGITTAIERNPTETCGESVNECLTKKFSSGVVTVPPGKHTVRIEWADNGLIPNTTEADRELDWIAHPKRRFQWKRDNCG
ncbi:hypothetical protein H0H81_009199 [Sphagnurus paluster]|uniref:Uncharacterized protein n=1 Tax=Sphagnurus paluster TaxID=117069 RepID=A0A9P7FS79_9AGAR|nr:hypothetical protein H0H81_009199 [Sphagnurus paluster]